LFPESDLGKAEPFPALGALHERHYGLTKELEAAWAQAAEVCLSRHHESPAALTVSTDGSVNSRPMSATDSRVGVSHEDEFGQSLKRAFGEPQDRV